MSVPTVTFHNGLKMPMFGLGTYKSIHKQVEEAVKYAIEVGYRHIDTAAVYENEKDVGRAIRAKIEDGTVTREDLFITTKVWLHDHREDLVVPACKKSLKKLGLDYVDLYLIHWPCGYQRDGSGQTINVDYIDTWKGMEECNRQGLARSIGVSNFNSHQLGRILSAATIKPVNNQIEVTMNLSQKPLIAFCKKNNVTVTGYSPLGRPGGAHGVNNLWETPLIQGICKKYGKTPAQVACRFVCGAAPIPKSVTNSRIKENIDIFDFNLSDEEMDSIRKIGTGERVALLEFAKDHEYYPFHFDEDGERQK